MRATEADARGGSRTGNILSSLAVAAGCVLFLGGFVWAALLYQPYTVPTDSMDPTVKAGTKVLAERIDGAEVRRGDVVVFRDPAWGETPMVKRVVGVDGDTVGCCREGTLTVNGEPIDEPYRKDAGSQPRFESTAVPKGELFLLGDHRTASLDSRSHLQDQDRGAVSRDAVSARVDAVAWPLSNLGMLPQAPGFAHLPGGVSEPGPLRQLLVAVGAGAVLILAGAAYGPIVRRTGRGGRG